MIPSFEPTLPSARMGPLLERAAELELARAMKQSFDADSAIARKQRIALAHMEAERELEQSASLASLYTLEGVADVHGAIYRRLNAMDRLTDEGEVIFSTVPCLALVDVWTEKLLANSDRGADTSQLHRDVLDLGVLRQRVGVISLLAMVWMGCGGAPQTTSRRILPPEEETFTRWPTEVDGIEDATRLFAGLQPCVLRASGEIACIGTREDIAYAGPAFARQHADAVFRDELGRVLKDLEDAAAAHARNLAESGELEAPRALHIWTHPRTPFEVPVLAESFHAGAARVEINGGCAVVHEGRAVACWGGDVSIDTPTVTAMPAGEEAVEVAFTVERVTLTCCMGCMPSGPHWCARLASGRVACWGSNTVGELGDGTRVDRTEPTLVQGLNDARAIVSGEHHNCVIRADESAWCWGYGADGMLGDGAQVSRPRPVRVRNVDHVVSLSLGGYHSCALDSQGRAFCWGSMNRFGMRETGNLEAVFLGAPERLVEIAAGDGYTCARSETGRVFCGGWY